MNELLDLRDKLRDTQAAMASLKAAVLADPHAEGLDLMLQSLEQRQQDLETAFRQAAHLEQVEVCSYRLIQERDDILPVAALGDTLKSFQTWLTTLFDAVRSGPKQKARVAADVVEQSTLDFAYAFSGSLGFVFTVPNERLLLGDTDLDRAISAMFAMMRVREQTQLVEFAHTLGVGVIRRMYEWASTQTHYAVSTDIKWRRKEEVRNEILLQAPEASNLCDLINATSDAEGEEINVVGELVGGDLVTLTFHLRFPEAEDMRGRISPKFSYPGELALRRTYKARIFKTTTIHFATDSETISYELLNLEPG